MLENNLQIGSDLNTDTQLYRYCRIEDFLSFIESKRTHLSNINKWDDRWEAIVSKLPVLDEKGNVQNRLYSSHEDLVGQCWTLLSESDAMWRIYSPHKTGVLISTTVEKFKLIEGIKRAYIGRVKYFNSPEDLIESTKRCNNQFEEMCLKRSAFQHEEEVRLLTFSGLAEKPYRESGDLTLPLCPTSFINSITIDPRAPQWFVKTVAKYCARAGITVPTKQSSLYETNPESTLGLGIQWKPINKDI